jgi:tetratricopeptide (TPR) repeat protein
MKLGGCWKLLCLCALGCQSLAGSEESKALQSWQKGQIAKRQGAPERAVAYYEQSLAQDASLTQNHLSLAAALLEKGDEAAACPHLEQYLARHPQHLQVRSYYAELLLRQERCKESRLQFEQFIADAQGDPSTLRERIQGHCRLMEIAELAENDYDAHLHRGIGMFLLALRRTSFVEDEVELSAEGLLCKAAGELVSAAALRPDEARPCWYLYAVWRRLAQQQMAEEWLARAREAAPYSFLTPTEQRQLMLACHRLAGKSS